MASSEKFGRKLLTFLKNLATKNVAIKVIALLFAVMLWGYVLTDQNPYRVKNVAQVNTSFDGEAELMAQGLCVRGDRSAILSAVTVAVSTQITNYANLSATSVSAVISLKNISTAGEYDLPIQASVTSAIGVVQSVTPSTVHVEIDSLVAKTVPVITNVEGTVANGYYADKANMSSTSSIVVEGPKTDIARINKAVCTVNIDGRNSTVYSTFDVVFYDSEGEVVSSDVIVGTLPASTVRLPVYPLKEVPIDVESSLVGMDNIPSNYELYAATASPSTVRIIGEQSILDEIGSLTIEPIAIGGLTEAFTADAELVLPDGVRVIDGLAVTVHVDIREIVEEVDFPQLVIEVRGLGDGLAATLAMESVDLHLEGRTSILQILKRGDIEVFIDVTDLTAGVYTVPLQLLLKNEEWTVELTSTLSETDVRVTIAPAS